MCPEIVLVVLPVVTKLELLLLIDTQFIHIFRHWLAIFLYFLSLHLLLQASLLIFPFFLLTFDTWGNHVNQFDPESAIDNLY